MLSFADTHSAEETIRLGERFAAALRPGDIVLLSGELGAGKTMFVKGIVKGLGSDDHVSSPTFVLVHEYRGRLPVAHVDLYRLAGNEDIESIGLEDYRDGSTVLLVEWPDRAAAHAWEGPCWGVSIEQAGDLIRRFAFTSPPGRETWE